MVIGRFTCNPCYLICTRTFQLFRKYALYMQAHRQASLGQASKLLFGLAAAGISCSAIAQAAEERLNPGTVPLANCTSDYSTTIFEPIRCCWTLLHHIAMVGNMDTIFLCACVVMPAHASASASNGVIWFVSQITQTYILTLCIFPVHDMPDQIKNAMQRYFMTWRMIWSAGSMQTRREQWPCCPA